MKLFRKCFPMQESIRKEVGEICSNIILNPGLWKEDVVSTSSFWEQNNLAIHIFHGANGPEKVSFFKPKGPIVLNKAEQAALSKAFSQIKKMSRNSEERKQWAAIGKELQQ